MSSYLFRDPKQKPGKRPAKELLGENLGDLCSELFVHTAEEFGGMEDFRANWLWDDVNKSWYWVISKKDTDIYTIYAMKDSLVCHFIFKNSVEASNMGYSAWQYVSNAESVERANEAITYAVKTSAA